MTIFDYAIIVIILLAFAMSPVGYYPTGKCNKACNKYLVFIGAILILISGLRHQSIGLDTYQYSNLFHSIPNGILKAFKECRHEEGYVLLNYLFKELDFVFIPISVSLLLVGLSFLVIRKYSPSIMLSCLLFVIYCFYYRCFNEMRQAMALGVICYSFHFIDQKNIKKYITCILIAALFHRTSIIFLPSIILFLTDKIKWWQLGGLLVVAILITMNAVVVLNIFLPFFQVDYSNIEEGAGGWGLLAVQVMTFFFALLRLKRLKHDRTNIILIYLLGMAIVIFPLCHLNPMLFRLEDYFWIFMIILVPRIICTFNSKIIRIFANLGYIIVGYFFYFVNVFSEANQILPFKFIWE